MQINQIPTLGVLDPLKGCTSHLINLTVLVQFKILSLDIEINVHKFEISNLREYFVIFFTKQGQKKVYFRDCFVLCFNLI